MIKPLKFEDFGALSITYGFFGRHGGVSDGVFGSLNMKMGTGDDDEAVHENYIRVTEALGIEDDQLTYITQVHGAICHVTDKVLSPDLEGDAIVTDTPGLGIGVLTADCAPVLFYGQKDDGSPVIGAAHAGWGGAVKGILEATRDAMLQAGAKLPSLQAAIGPCITQKSYEVSTGFEKPFLEEDPESARFFKLMLDGKQQFDLPGYVAFRLKRSGINQITVGGQDTYSEESDWFSYRRSTHRNEGQGGRQISAICIRNG
jgi:YfiH family protein